MKPIRAGKGVEVREILISKIIGSLCRMRLEYDYEQEELGMSIRECGVLNPIKVKPVKGGFKIFAGHRRLDRAKDLGYKTIKAEIWGEVSERDAALMGFVDNINRKDFALIEEGYAYQKLIEEYKYTVDDLLKSCGKSRSRIYTLLKLVTNLSPAMVKAIIDGKMSSGHGEWLLRIEDNNLRERLFREVLAGKWNLADLKYFVYRQKPDSEKKDWQLQLDIIEDICESDPGIQAIWKKELKIARSRKGLKITMKVNGPLDLLRKFETVTNPIEKSIKKFERFKEKY